MGLQGASCRGYYYGLRVCRVHGQAPQVVVVEAVGEPFPGVSPVRALRVTPPCGEVPVSRRRVEAARRAFADGQGVGVERTIVWPVFPGFSSVMAPYEGTGLR